MMPTLNDLILQGCQLIAISGAPISMKLNTEYFGTHGVCMEPC